ncbi:MAG TPA: hypothetical protein VGO37_04780 [Steroidobacteraceae bacterium]|jgi:hypothetical protein|nr:hypothetical protein [Steroidobacteraceae bacterium]
MSGSLAAKRVVYLIEQPLDERNFQRFGIQAWMDRQWNVEVWDLTPWAHPRVWQNFMERGHSVKKFAGYFPLKSRSELQGRLRSPTAIQYVIDLTGDTFHSVRAKLALRRMGATRVICATGSIPLPDRDTSRGSISRLGKIFAKGPRGAWKWLSNSFFSRVVGPRIPAELAVISGTQSMTLSRSSGMIKAHNFDYDIYLELVKSALPDSGEYAVFIDQDYCFHLEFIYQGTASVVTAERYFPAVCNGLEAISAALDLEVRIAAHPRASYDQSGKQQFFREFRIERGRTAEMIRACNAVICHDSTAIQYAVLFCKPIIFVTTDELSRAHEGASIEKVAAELGKKPVNLDRDDLRLIDWRDELKIDFDKYAKYRSKYIKADGSPDLPLWTIVIDYADRAIGGLPAA